LPSNCPDHIAKLLRKAATNESTSHSNGGLIKGNFRRTFNMAKLDQHARAILDVETTGLSPWFGDRICEIAVARCQGQPG
jgi:DNA polymerase III epsilon subunit-like protein